MITRGIVALLPITHAICASVRQFFPRCMPPGAPPRTGSSPAERMHCSPAILRHAGDFGCPLILLFPSAYRRETLLLEFRRIQGPATATFAGARGPFHVPRRVPSFRLEECRPNHRRRASAHDKAIGSCGAAAVNHHDAAADMGRAQLSLWRTRHLKQRTKRAAKCVE